MADARAPSGGAGPPAGTKSKHSRGVNLNLADRAERAAKAKAAEEAFERHRVEEARERASAGGSSQRSVRTPKAGSAGAPRRVISEHLLAADAAVRKAVHHHGTRAVARKAAQAGPVNPRACLCLTPRNPLRALALAIARSWQFDLLYTFIIMCNAIVMGLTDPLDYVDPPSGIRNQIVKAAEGPFQYLYTAEMVIKLVAFGGFGPNSYIADRWNWLDGGVVLIGWLGYVPGVSNVTALRIFRLLRPVRKMNSLPGMRIILKSIINALPGLTDVAMLVLMAMFMYGMIGVELWNGVMQGQCAYVDYWANPTFDPFDTDPSSPNATGPLVFPTATGFLQNVMYCSLPCSAFEGDCTATYGDDCPPTAWMQRTAPDGVSTLLAPTPMICSRGSSPDWGQTNFDTVPRGMFTSFAMITTEGWSTNVMYVLWHTWGNQWLVSILTMIHMLFGSAFLLELTLAVLWDQYSAAVAAEADTEAAILKIVHRRLVEQEKAALEEERRKFLLLWSGDGGGAGGAAAAEQPPLVKVAEEPLEKVLSYEEEMILAEEQEVLAGRRLSEIIDVAAVAEAMNAHIDKVEKAERKLRRAESRRIGKLARLADGGTPSAQTPNSSTSPSPPKGSPPKGGATPKLSEAAAGGGEGATPRDGDDGETVDSDSSPNSNDEEEEDDDEPWLHVADLSVPRFVSASGRVAIIVPPSIGAALGFVFAVLHRLYVDYVPPPPLFLSRPALRLAKNPNFDFFFTALVIANVIMMGCAYEGQSDRYTAMLSLLNTIFVGFFCVEALAKMFAYGFAEFIADAFNAFDFVIIVISVVDIIMTALNPDGGGPGGISALRTFRIFRVFKLVKSWDSLRILMTALVRGVAMASNAFVLLGLVMYIFALLGMQIFGDGYDYVAGNGGPQNGALNVCSPGVSGCDTPQLNFQNLWWSIITVFEVMDNENWDGTAKYHMMGWGFGYAFFFMAIIIIGNYIFLNLFITILMSVLEDDGAEDEPADAPAADAVAAADAKAKGEGKEGGPNAVADAPVAAAPGLALVSTQDLPWYQRVTTRMQSRLLRMRHARSHQAACALCMGMGAEEAEEPSAPARDLHGIELVQPPHKAHGGAHADGQPHGRHHMLNHVNPHVLRAEAEAAAEARLAEEAAARGEAPYSPPSDFSDLHKLERELAGDAKGGSPGGAVRLAPLRLGGGGGTAGAAGANDAGAAGVSLKPVPLAATGTAAAQASAQATATAEAASAAEAMASAAAEAPKLKRDKSVKRVDAAAEETGGINFHTTGAGVADSVEISLPTKAVNVAGAQAGASKGDLPKGLDTAKSVKVVITQAGGWKVVTAQDGEGTKGRVRKLRQPGDVPKPPHPMWAFLCCCAGGRKRGAKVAPNAPQLPPTDSELYEDEPLLTRLYYAVGNFVAFPSHADIQADENVPFFVEPLYLTKENWLRSSICRLYKWWLFEQLTLLAILISCVNLGLDQPVVGECKDYPLSDPKNCVGLYDYLRACDVIITWYFTAELGVAILSKGLWSDPNNSMLRTGWSLLDVVVVSVSIAGLLSPSGGSQVKALRSLRAFRALRALRAVSRLPALRLVIDALFMAVPRVKETVTVILLIMYIFAVIGLQNFSGGAWVCNDTSQDSFEACTGADDPNSTYYAGPFVVSGDGCQLANSSLNEDFCRNNPNGLVIQRAWYLGPWNFDNIGNAMLVVFELVTGENWPTIMGAGVNFVGPQQVAKNNANPPAAIYVSLAARASTSTSGSSRLRA